MQTLHTTLSPFHQRLTEAAGKISYRQLGKITETHPETVRRYMQGQTPSATYIQSFCDALQISSDWLLTGEGPKNRGEIRTHALKNADASELLVAIADTLAAMNSRVEMMEQFMQSIENRLEPAMEVLKEGVHETETLMHTEAKTNTKVLDQNAPTDASLAHTPTDALVSSPPTTDRTSLPAA